VVTCGLTNGSRLVALNEISRLCDHVPNPTSLGRPDQPLGLPLGGHIYLRALIGGETVMRPYTPTSIAEQLGSFDLVIKVTCTQAERDWALICSVENGVLTQIICVRASTPTLLPFQVYGPNQDPKHPEGGKMSQHLDRLQLGDTVDVKGPIGRFLYKGRGQVEIGGRPLPGRVTHFGMLAGGTGECVRWGGNSGWLR
jgi:hypothetical protein